MTVHVPLIDPLFGGACGDVAAARSAASVLLDPIRSKGVDLDRARLILTAVILALQARLERVALSDVVAALAAFRDVGGPPFADSPMQFLQYAGAELTEMSVDARLTALRLCACAVGQLPPE